MDEVLFALPFVYWLIRDLAIFYGLCGVPAFASIADATAAPPLQSRVGAMGALILRLFSFSLQIGDTVLP